MQQQNNSTVLSGKIKKRSKNSIIEQGHIKYYIYSENGQVIEHGQVGYSSGISLRTWKHGSNFSFILPNNMPNGANISLAWQANK
jgi:hypothetical protein